MKTPKVSVAIMGPCGYLPAPMHDNFDLHLICAKQREPEMNFQGKTGLDPVTTRGGEGGLGGEAKSGFCGADKLSDQSKMSDQPDSVSYYRKGSSAHAFS